MKRFLLIILMQIFVLAACSTRDRSMEMASDADPNHVPDLAGEYAVNGFDPLGQEYGGRLTIVAGNQVGMYEMQWIVVGSIQKGTGIVEGNQLLVVWHSVENSTSQSSGKAVYTITQAGELYGTRTVEGYSESGTEQAFPNQ